MLVQYYDVLVVFILGIMEGITEFLPVSSTGHMILISSLLGFQNDKFKMFEVIFQFGSILSIIIKFWRKFFFIFTNFSFNKKIIIYYEKYAMNFSFWHIFFGILPIVIFGYFFYKKIKLFFELEFVMYSLICGSLLLLIAEYIVYNFYDRYVDCYKLSYLQAFFIGCFQCLALFPGFSRSGATISGGLLIGLNRYLSFEFSLFLAVPVVFGASVFDLYKNFLYITCYDMFLLFVGIVTSFAVTFFSIDYFLQLIKRINFIPFVIYRFFLAGIIYLVILNL